MGSWKQTTKQDNNRRIFETELDDFLPSKILDFHVHVFPAMAKKGRRPYSCAGHPLRAYTIKNFLADSSKAYPGREVYAVCFGMPFPDWRQRTNDEYTARACDRRRTFPIRLLDPTHDSAQAVTDDVRRYGFVGLKPYPDYVRHVPKNEIRIADMLPDNVMEAVDSLGLIVVLHIPRPNRLADQVNRKDVVSLCKRWPRARIVLAHVGRAYYLKNVVEGLNGLCDLPNLWFDTAMLNNWEVLAHLFRKADHSRVVFGTDAPIAFAPGKAVEINNQYTYVTPVPWELSICDTAGRIVFTSFLYEEIRAIRRAAEETGKGREFIDNLFFNNGMELLAKRAGKESQKMEEK